MQKSGITVTSLGDLSFLERIPLNLLLEPIEFIFADHCRQRDMCAALKVVASAEHSDETGPTEDIAHTARMVLQCLTVDLPLHFADEECDLFPRLMKASTPRDKTDEIVRLLRQEHKRDKDLVMGVMPGLETLANKQPLKDVSRFRTAARIFSETHLAHINWENAVILELARIQLSAEEQADMAKSLAKRRKIELP